jgi:small-conductance mechanosensitive channel
MVSSYTHPFLSIPTILYNKAAIFTKNLGNSLIPVWTAFTGVSFAIQDPVKELISNCIFVFAQHPYDVGDWVVLDQEEKNQRLIVSSIYLTHTTFIRVDNGKFVHIPHATLGKE